MYTQVLDLANDNVLCNYPLSMEKSTVKKRRRKGIGERVGSDSDDSINSKCVLAYDENADD
jgi:hypothetical protein